MRETEPSATLVLDSVRRHLSPGLALGYNLLAKGAVETGASGATVRLSDGRELVDFGSYAVTLLGHRPPDVVAAVHAQLDLMPTATRALANPAVARFAAALAARTAPLNRIWLGSDGADAVEAAVKLARRASGRTRVLAVEGAFHGKTLGALALTSAPVYRAGLEPLLAGVTRVGREDAEAVARHCAAGDVAALIMEPVQGEGGVRRLPHAARWAADARSAGAFVISDEIQAGLHRCGPFSVALAEGWRPDAVLFGKALGGGVLPLSALTATDELYAPLLKDPTWHTATFGGHPLSCAAGTAALAALDRLAPRGEELSSRVREGLAALAAEHPDLITEVRGHGLLWGMDFASPAVAGGVFTELADHGLLVSPCLGSPHTIRLLPPLVTTGAELDRALEALAKACTAARDYLEPR
ncbi:aspartate aminotransferase family protein [Actinocorallia sp. B10E7]|uniref:aspartate aminotransferase family protein n=1 Tax=Actinocorallia sp. B10E7 TaxID=3153558 RepID=UPI00325F509A